MNTDMQLQQDVMAELVWDPALHGTQIGVEVQEGVVTLAGEVESYAEKLLAQRAAQRVIGVRALADEMTVKPMQWGTRSDADIAGSAREILSWVSALPPNSVQVKVESGYLTLTGDVDCQYQRLVAARNLRYMPGVTGICNQIAVKQCPPGSEFKSEMAPAPQRSPGEGATMKTDAQLQQDVRAELKREPSINAAHIGVEVRDGVVTLAGQVDSYTEKWQTERAAQRASGVHVMTTELKVQLPGPLKRTDGDIARAVKNVLEWNSLVPGDAIEVIVECGWVTLSGSVHWQYQKEAATEGIRSLMGVVGVIDDISIVPAVTADAVQADIEAALMRSAASGAKDITVQVDGAEVSLSGTVHTWAEREMATDAAWRTPGVRRVVDRLSIVH